MFKMIVAALLSMVFLSVSAYAQDGKKDSPKILIAFFSKTNNTRTIAEMIQSSVGGDLFHVYTKKTYPEDYRETTRIARVELDNNERPELGATISSEDMKKYDVIFIGYPNWWGTLPMAFFTFLEQYDLSGKTIVPFCTHEGSGLGRGPDDLRKLCPNSDVFQGLAIRGSAVSRSKRDVEIWLKRNGFIQ